MKKSLLSIALGGVLSSISVLGYAWPPSQGCEDVRLELADALISLQICKAIPDANCDVERTRFHACVALALNEERGGICPDGSPVDQPEVAADCFDTVNEVSSAN